MRQLGVGRRFPLETINEFMRSNPQDRVFMSEIGFNQYHPQHSLTMFREPTSHVLSQFFHCKESKEHRRNDRHLAMPDTLLEWLQGWLELRQKNPALERNISDPRKRWNDPKYICFVPLNFQSWITTFPKSKEDVMALFDVVGILENVQKSFCLFLVHILETVPNYCNCTNGPSEYKGREKKADHGVQHHGSSYIPTRKERILIEELTTLDRELYRHVTELFLELVAQAEKTYHVELCGKAKAY